MKRKIKTKDKIRLLWLCMIALTGFIIASFGAMSNSVVMNENDCKMPVLNYYHTQDTHFGYKIEDNIPYWFLADNFDLGDSIYSIGDFLIYGGLLESLIMSIIIIIYCIKIGVYKK